jgi:hypothetical protein
MKKILTPILLITILLVTLGCEQSDYDIKTLIVKNESEVNIHSLNILLADGYIDQRVILVENYPIIYPGDSKEYAIPYKRTGKTSPEIQVYVGDGVTYRSISRGSTASRRIIFTFNTSLLSENITLTFDEGEEVETYQLTGTGSGFEEIILQDL